jgi:hypothetical protein
MSSTELEARRARAAKNQSLFREVNERIEGIRPDPSMFEERMPANPVDFACECTNDACVDHLTLTVGDYESVRAESNQFIVKPGHDIPEVERIVREGDGYVVVAKLGPGVAVAEKLDPRRRMR